MMGRNMQCVEIQPERCDIVLAGHVVRRIFVFDYLAHVLEPPELIIRLFRIGVQTLQARYHNVLSSKHQNRDYFSRLDNYHRP